MGSLAGFRSGSVSLATILLLSAGLSGQVLATPPQISQHAAPPVIWTQLYDGPDSQRPVGFAPQDRWGMYHLLPVAAAESSADGRGGSGGAASSDQAELAKKLQNPIADLVVFQTWI